MSASFAITMAVLAFGSMWACWKLGFEAGENSVLDQFRDYCKWRDMQKNTPSRDNRQGE